MNIMGFEKMIFESIPIKRGKKLYAFVECGCCGHTYYLPSKDCNYVGYNSLAEKYFADVDCCNCGCEITRCPLVEEDELEFPEEVKNG